MIVDANVPVVNTRNKAKAGVHAITAPQENVARKCTYEFYLATFTTASHLVMCGEPFREQHVFR